jgi:hypothetical protein
LSSFAFRGHYLADETALDDHDLLAQYARTESEPAFATLAALHVNKCIPPRCASPAIRYMPRKSARL